MSEQEDKEAIRISEGWSREVRWSEEDNCYVGSLPEVCGDCCDADNITDVLRLLDEIALGYAYDKILGVFPPALEVPGDVLVDLVHTLENEPRKSSDHAVESLREAMKDTNL